MLLIPSRSEYAALRSMAASGTSFDGADQGLLNEYFAHHPWHRLSFTYNCTPSGSYQYEPAYRHFKNDIKLVHFIGKEKPWTKGRRALQNEQSNVYKELLGRWWAVYDKHYTAVVRMLEWLRITRLMLTLIITATVSFTTTRSSNRVPSAVRIRRGRTQYFQLGRNWTYSTGNTYTISSCISSCICTRTCKARAITRKARSIR